MSKKVSSYLLGVFEDDEVVIKAVKKIREQGYNVHEVYSPYPLHGIDPALGYKRSKMPIAAFLFGFAGFSFATWMQLYMSGFDWPLNIGGKPFFAWPSYVPIMFELTVLIGALGMVATFLVSSNLKPVGYKNPLDLRATDDKIIVAFDRAKINVERVTELLKEYGASEINAKEL